MSNMKSLLKLFESEQSISARECLAATLGVKLVHVNRSTRPDQMMYSGPRLSADALVANNPNITWQCDDDPGCGHDDGFDYIFVDDECHGQQAVALDKYDNIIDFQMV